MKTNAINIPNMLSAYRLLALPFLSYAIATENSQQFILLLSLNLITDILDGFIARTFHLETELGARLDSFADIGTYLMAFTGMLVLQHPFVMQHYSQFMLLAGLYVTPQLISLLRFQRTTSLHLYSSKVLGYIQGIFIFHLFMFGGSTGFFNLMVCFGYATYLEALIIVLLTPRLRSNVKGLYFMYRDFKTIC